MNDDTSRSTGLLEDIARMHEHFVRLMNERLAEVSVEDLERYFALMSRLVEKLEEREKSLRDVAREMAGESAGWIMAELSRPPS